MNQLLILLTKIKDLWPYLLLVLVYFFFINAEASRDREASKGNNVTIVEDSKVIRSIDQNIETINPVNQRITIPVLPFMPNDI